MYILPPTFSNISIVEINRLHVDDPDRIALLEPKVQNAWDEPIPPEVEAKTKFR